MNEQERDRMVELEILDYMDPESRYGASPRRPCAGRAAAVAIIWDEDEDKDEDD